MTKATHDKMLSKKHNISKPFDKGRTKGVENTTKRLKNEPTKTANDKTHEKRSLRPKHYLNSMKLQKHITTYPVLTMSLSDASCLSRQL